MTSEVEERPRLVTAGYGRYESQWINVKQYYLIYMLYNILGHLHLLLHMRVTLSTLTHIRFFRVLHDNHCNEWSSTKYILLTDIQSMPPR